MAALSGLTARIDFSDPDKPDKPDEPRCGCKTCHGCIAVFFEQPARVDSGADGLSRI